VKRFVLSLARGIFGLAPRVIVRIIFGDIWRLRNFIQASRESCNILKKLLSILVAQLAVKYWESYGSWVGTNAIIESPPIFPHGPIGFFVSNNAHIGKNSVIFQHVTIGSNNLKDSKSNGSPYLEDNVYIGCGAKIIGNVHVGKNARIGANCVVVKDVPDNSVTIIRCVESIVKGVALDNEFVPVL